MHPVQQRILNLFTNTDSLDLKLREIARLIDVLHPQTVKYHLLDLQRREAIKIDFDNKKIKLIDHSIVDSGSLVALPIYGSANCGRASSFAENYIEGFLKVSKRILNNYNNDLFVLKAVGDSMNCAVVNGGNIEDNDYVVIDSTYIDPKNNDYVVSIIDGCANIKKIVRDEKNNQIILFSESTHDYSPIYIHKDDTYQIAGKVTQVIKNPSNIANV